ncbi:MAG: flagellar hook-associated protein FlgL [Deltaproteobacteria bacterium]|nr:flagellar hook-associated protein FlgL [Deltaproteobacteria bacterium]
MRVTQNMIYQSILGGILNNQERLLEYQTQVSTGKQVLKASDGPLDMGRILSYREVISRTEQYPRNIVRADSWLSTTESVLQEASNLLQGAKTLAVQQANGTQSAESRQAAVTEIEGVIESLIRLGNTRVGNSYIFGGTRTAYAPFNADGTYNGNGKSIQAEINDGVFQAYNLPGSDFLVADLNPVIAEPHNNTGKLAYAYSGMATGQQAQLNNWVLSNPADNSTYDITITLDDGVDHTVSYTTSASATQDELGRGLVRAVRHDLDLNDAVDATYEDGVFSLTAKASDETGNSYKMRTVTTPFSTSHSRFSGAVAEVDSGFVFDDTNDSLVFVETGYAAVNTVSAALGDTTYSINFQFGNTEETITVNYGVPPTQDALGADLADAVNGNTVLSQWLTARYDATTDELTVAAKAGVPGSDTFTATETAGTAFDQTQVESTFNRKDFTVTADLLADSDAVRGVVYDGKEVARFVAQAMEAKSAASGFSFEYSVEYDFIDDQETLNRFTITNNQSNNSDMQLLWTASEIRETLAFANRDPNPLNAGDVVTSEEEVEFTILSGVNDRFRINVDGGGVTEITLAAGAYTAEELADHMQSRINAATNAVKVDYSESRGGQFAITSQSSGMTSTIRLMAGEGPERQSDFLRTIGFSTEAGITIAGSGPGSLDSTTLLNLDSILNPSNHQIDLTLQAGGTWAIADNGGFPSLSVTSSNASSIELDFDGDLVGDLHLDVSGWAAGQTLSLDLAREYRENSYYDDGTDSVFVKDLNGGAGIRMEAPPQYVVDAFNNSISYNSDLGGGVLAIPSGTYTGEELAAVIEQEFNNATASMDFSVNYSDGRFSIAKRGGSLDLDWADPASTALGLLGFRPYATSGALSYTSDYAVQTYHVSAMDRAGNLARIDMAPFEVIGGGANRNNIIRFNDGGVAQVEIPPGFYDGAQLAQAIESRMEAESLASGGGHDYTVEFRDGTFTFINEDGAPPVTLDWTVAGNASDLLGFVNGSTLVGEVSYTSQFVIPDLTVHDFVERMNAGFASAGVNITVLMNGEGNGLELIDTNDPRDRVTNMRVFMSDTARDLGIYKEDRLITIDDNINTVYFSIPSAASGTTYQATLTPGTYNGNQMAKALKNVLEQALDITDPTNETTATFQVDYSPDRGVFAITPSTEMEIHWVTSPLPAGAGSSAASVLGITTDWVFSGAGPFSPQYSDETAGAEGMPSSITGTDLNPLLKAYTGVGDLYGGAGVDPGKIEIVNGSKRVEVDLEGVRNMRELMARINSADVEVRSKFNKNSTALKLESLIDGAVPVVLSVDDDTAQLLGLSAGRDILDTLYDFKQALMNNDSESLENVAANLQAGMDRFSEHLVESGARLQIVDQTQQYIEQYSLELKGLLSEAEDVDITEAITRLLNQEQAVQATLQSASRLVSLSLLDFLD